MASKFSFSDCLDKIKAYSSLSKGEYDVIIEIDRTKNKQFMWRLKGLNGSIITASEPIKQRKNVYSIVGKMLYFGLQAKVKDLTLS